MLSRRSLLMTVVAGLARPVMAQADTTDERHQPRPLRGYQLQPIVVKFIYQGVK